MHTLCFPKETTATPNLEIAVFVLTPKWHGRQVGINMSVRQYGTKHLSPSLRGLFGSPPELLS